MTRTASAGTINWMPIPASIPIDKHGVTHIINDPIIGHFSICFGFPGRAAEPKLTLCPRHCDLM